MNKLLLCDYYKATHHKLYPPKTEYVHSYIESRGTSLNSHQTLFFGLQGFIKEYLEGQFFSNADIIEASEIYQQGFGYNYFNLEGWTLLLERHAGRLPVKICALPEGSITNCGTVLLTIENTDPEFYWLPQWLETMLLRGIWYPTTVATVSLEAKRIINHYANLSGCDVSDFHLLDFGARGVSSHESASIGGAAHLLSFKGTDNVEGVKYLADYYDAPVSGFSVMASEHSLTCAWGETSEMLCYLNMLAQAPDDATVSIVIDTYDDMRAIRWLGHLHAKKIKARRGLTVFRPDSGDPIQNPIAVLKELYDKFGGTINEKGYIVLHPKIKVLQGDGISLSMLPDLCREIIAEGFCLSNIMFGMGGKLLQGFNRDTLKFAQKASNVVIDGISIPISKRSTGKVSKEGRFESPQLETVFLNGELVRHTTLEQIKEVINGTS